MVHVLTLGPYKFHLSNQRVKKIETRQIIFIDFRNISIKF